MKQYLTRTKGFTLVELLIVIAIIGILASIVLVSLSSARLKAKDAAIISAANSMMMMAQIDAMETGNYSAYYMAIWGAGDENTCDYYWGSTSNPQGMRSACKSIVRNVGGVTAYPTWQSTWGSPTYPKLSIMAYLPSSGKLYCVGSNGGSSMTSDLGGSGCGSAGSWSCSGCAGDTTANGS